MATIRRGSRNPRVVTAFAVCVLALLAIGWAFSLLDAGSAGTGPKIIRGYVRDSSGSSVAGANVTVKMFSGLVLTDTQYYDSSESNGFYTVTFGDSVWNTGYTVEVTAKYSSLTAVNSTTVNGDPIQYVDVMFSTPIPEFGSTVLIPVAAMILVLLALRMKRNS